VETDAFLKSFAAAFSDDGGIPRPAAEIPAFFHEVLGDVEGMATPAELYLLNLAARHLGENEVFLEAGTNRGATIIAASHEVDRRFVTVDNFSWSIYPWFAGAYEVAKGNLARYGRARVEALDGSIWDVLERWEGQNVGVWFYDADHRFIDQWRALSLGERVLADEALVIVDDISFPAVAAASDAFVQTHPRFEEVLRLERDAVGTWDSGVAIYRYRREGPAASSAAAAAALAGAGARYITGHPKAVRETARGLYCRLPAGFRDRVRPLLRRDERQRP
jgi:predicted O-methyltransferase YrrM